MHRPNSTTLGRVAGYLLLAAVLTALLVPAGCGPRAGRGPELIVLHTGRLAGNVYPLDIRGAVPLQYYPLLAGYVSQVRAEAAAVGAQVLLVDLGDSLAGSFAAHATHSRNMVTFFNALEYDAIVLGNLDSDVPADAQLALKAAVLTPFVTEEGAPAIPGTDVVATLAKGPLQISLIANFYGDVEVSRFPHRFPTRFGPHESGIRPARNYVGRLGNKPPGGVRLFCWMKFESPEQPPESFLEGLGALGVDAILAHRIYGSDAKDVWSERAYDDWRPPVSENILRRNAGFTVARMDLARRGNDWAVLSKQLVPMTSNVAPRDEAIAEVIAGFAGEIEAADSAVADLAEPAGHTAILDWFLAALASVPGADAVLYSPDSIRDEWPEGMLTAGRVFNALPWMNPLVRVHLLEEELATLKSNPDLVLWTRDAAAGGARALVTSRYFASLVQRELGLPNERISVLDTPAEFEFFLDHLRDHPTPQTVPDGWSDERAR